MSPTFTTHDGKVFYRNTYHDADECARLLAVLRLQSTEPGWWAKEARGLADELEAAMRAAEQQHTQQEAA